MLHIDFNRLREIWQLHFTEAQANILFDSSFCGFSPLEVSFELQIE